MAWTQIVSLGYCCETAWNLDRLGLRTESQLFDWTLTPCQSCLIRTLKTGFADMFGWLTGLTCGATGFTVFHEEDGLDSGKFAAVADKYRNRRERFLELTGRGRVAFIRSMHHQIPFSITDHQELKTALQSLGFQDFELFTFVRNSPVNLQDYYPYLQHQAALPDQETHGPDFWRGDAEDWDQLIASVVEAGA